MDCPVTLERLERKFVGALLGTFCGDALGMPYETWPPERIARHVGRPDTMHGATLWLRGYAVTYGALRGAVGGLPLGVGTYTDDTQMMIAVAESLVERGGFDGTDMARRFVEAFDPRRGYGRGTIQALSMLRRGIPWNEVGEKLFGGTGSFGNGAAMRVAPVGLLYHRDPAALREMSERQASITHAHPLGREGAALLAYAVARALTQGPDAAFDRMAFLEDLRAFLTPSSEPFLVKMDVVGGLLGGEPSPREVADALGNNTAAAGSVPAALYAFLARPDSFREAVVLAVSLGGTPTPSAPCAARSRARGMA